MSVSLSEDQVRRLRARAQGPGPYPAGAGGQRPRDAGAQHDGRSVHDDVVASITGAAAGIQAQNTAAADLSVRVRGRGLTVDDVRRAVVDRRSVVRTWCMRGTLHLVAATDVRWLLAALAPTAIAGGRRRMERLGLDAPTADRGVRRLAEVLADGRPRTRVEIIERLAGDDLPLEGQGIAHLLWYAALSGVLCNGPLRGRKDTYVLLDAWLGPARKGEPTPAGPGARRTPGRAADEADTVPDDLLARLAARYLAAFGPATLDDFAYWSGLRKRDARRGWSAIEAETVEVDAAGTLALMPADRVGWLDERAADAAPSVRLLPMFDTYLLGYRSRDLALAPAYADRLIPGGGGIIRATLLVDGRVRGTWKTQKARSGLEVLLDPFTPLSNAVLAAVDAEVADIGRFLGTAATLRVA